MKLVGLTGGIASGKSTVAGFFKNLHIPIINTDDLAHELTMHDADTIEAIVKALGRGVLVKDKIDKQQLKKIVFADIEKKTILEKILHPRIKNRLDEIVGELKEPYAIVEVPLLIEAGWDKYVDRVLLATAPETVRINRLIKRDAINNSMARKILTSQTDDATRMKYADDIIDTNQDLDKIKKKVLNLHNKYLQVLQ